MSRKVTTSGSIFPQLRRRIGRRVPVSSNAQVFQPQKVSRAGKEGSRQGECCVEVRPESSRVSESLLKRLLRKIFPDQRRYERLPLPPLVGYLGMLKTSKAFELSDIGVSGFRMLTGERWTPGTEMPITLQRLRELGEDDLEYFTVQATVVRCGPEGVAFSIVLDDDGSQTGNLSRSRWISKAEMESFLRRLKEQATEGTAPMVAEEKPAAGAALSLLQPGR